MARSTQPLLGGTPSSTPRGTCRQGRRQLPPGLWCPPLRRGLSLLAGLIGIQLLMGCGPAAVQRSGAEEPLPPLPQGIEVAFNHRGAGQYRSPISGQWRQGDDLEARNLKIGIVTSIVGIWSYRVQFTGVQNHAGTTRMAIRKDAGLAAAKLAVAIDQEFPKICAARTVCR